MLYKRPMRIPPVLGAALFAALAALPASAQEDFGARFKGGPYKTTIFVTNASCPGTHSVQMELQSAPWLRITGPNPVTVAEGETVIVDAELNLNATTLGVKNGRIQFTCLTCKPPCEQSVTTQTLTVTVLEREPTFNGTQHPNDNQFAGLDAAGQPRTICDLIKQILSDLGATAWGKGTRGGAILKTLNDKYADGNCSDITFVGTHQEPNPNGNGKPVNATDQADEQPVPGNAVYVRTLRIGGVIVPGAYSEEIYIGLDETATGIECARANPGAYYIFTHGGRLGVMKKEDLVHSLIHEGLHATQEGKFNAAKPNGGTGACLEEEQDAFKAGDEACTALGLPVTGGTAGKGYNAGSNTGYTPLK